MSEDGAGGTSASESSTESVAEESASRAPDPDPDSDDNRDHGSRRGVGRGVHDASKAVQHVISDGGDRREASRFSLMAEYSPLDLLVPGKLGGSIGYIQSRGLTNELEYLSASISVPFIIDDLGGYSDKRISLIRRTYADRNSFNFHYGLSYFEFDFHVGNKYLASASDFPASYNLMRSRSLGFLFGIGNRWVFPHGFSLGVDWISWAQPVYVIESNSELINHIQDQDARSVLDHAFRASQYFPRLTFFKFALGWIF